MIGTVYISETIKGPAKVFQLGKGQPQAGNLPGLLHLKCSGKNTGSLSSIVVDQEYFIPDPDPISTL